MASGHDLLGQAYTSSKSIAYWDAEACYVNLIGDDGYMTSGYYTSQDMEAIGKPIHPTCKEILDASIVPLFLEKARLAGLKTPAYYMTNDYFEPPVVVDSINPFMSRQSLVLKAGHQERVSKSLTRNFTYAICCQELPVGGRSGAFGVDTVHWRRRFGRYFACLWPSYAS